MVGKAVPFLVISVAADDPCSFRAGRFCIHMFVGEIVDAGHRDDEKRNRLADHQSRARDGAAQQPIERARVALADSGCGPRAAPKKNTNITVYEGTRYS